MMASAGILVILGQLDAVAAHLVHLTHMFAVGTDDLHVLARLGQMLPLGGALLPPAAEVAFETALALTAIIVILAVQRFYLAVPPLVIVAVALIRHTAAASATTRSEEHTSEIQTLMRNSYAV